MANPSPPLVWYFDVISPFAALAIPEMETLCETHVVEFRPVLFAGLLKAFGHLGPAEIPAKRTQTYRIVQWIADECGMPFRAPPAHPFNPLALLRLLCVRDLTVADAAAAFRLVWGEGRDPESADTAAALADALAVPLEAASDPAVKDRLRHNTETAVAAGVYGVPTLAIGDELFWGLDAMPMARAYLADPALFASGEMARVSNLPMAAQRPR
ncbi:2-hydroxychromene-2-carboxylate isomerase [Novosphingobium sp. Chol11]|uniref:2-hydroxychromene-2-carboxylate isomerase n=1 Tax=Novosphingobium sp. Chol11 TaxID=1385763 RepID=UPI0025CF668C|nr:DsbA family protein [Novosphingobium sp. Chol11]